MGSKSSSKSSSKSLLPKGLNLMHVVLAVVLGLLICSMLSTGNVEGFTGQASAKIPKGMDCKSISGGKYTWSQLSQDADNQQGLWGCKPATGTIDSISGWKSAVKSKDAADTTHTNKKTTGTLGPGVCKGKFSSTADKLCHHIDNDKTCLSEGAGICTWKNTGDIYSYSGGLEGVIYYDWMKALNWLDAKSQPLDISPGKAGTDLTAAGKVDLLPLRMGGSAITASDPTTGQKNFLDLINTKESKLAMGNDEKIPKALQEEVRDYIEACESGWDKYPDEYLLNGGRAIMGYNVSDGLVCRNPLHYPIIQPGNVSRIHDVDEGGCPSPTADHTRVSKKGNCEKRTSACNWDSSKTYGGAVSGAMYNNLPFSGSGPCGLDSCAADYTGQCVKTNAKNTIKDGAAWMSSFFKVG